MHRQVSLAKTLSLIAVWWACPGGGTDTRAWGVAAAATSDRGSHNTDHADTADMTDAVQLAIAKSRQHLQQHTPPNAPYAFPKTRYRLALLLESSSSSNNSGSNDNISVWLECALLYQQAALNDTVPMEPASQRLEALYRAAQILIDHEVNEGEDAEQGQFHYSNHSDNNNYNNDTRNILSAEQLLWTALKLDITSPSATNSNSNSQNPNVVSLETLYATIFETLVQLLLSKAAILQEHDGTNKAQLYQRILELCDYTTTAQLCPTEPVVDEYTGVTLRLLYSTWKHGAAVLHSEHAVRVYRSYEQAAHKSYAAVIAVLMDDSTPHNVEEWYYGTLPKLLDKQYVQQRMQDSNTDYLDLVNRLWTRLLRHIILAAAAAHEAGWMEACDAHHTFGLQIMSTLLEESLSPSTASSSLPSQIIAVDPVVHADFYVNIGIRYKKMAQHDTAAIYFRKALQVHPGDGHALVQLASIGESLCTDTLDDAYVAGLFDGYSSRFEHSLLHDLQYQGHVLVADTLLATMDLPSLAESASTKTTTQIVDLGCGTGLLGEVLRRTWVQSLASSCSTNHHIPELQLVGVDLSERMVALARARRNTCEESSSAANKFVYNQVRQMNALTYLQSLPGQSVTAIVAADVFIYIGALDDLWQACFDVLKSQGRVVFTVELPLDTDDEMALLKSGRFGHSRAYIQSTSSRHGFKLELWKEAVLRTQGGHNVAGAVAVLQKTG